MSTPDNPWHREPTPPRHRVYVWLAVMLAVTLGVWELFRLFPEVRFDGMNEARLVRLVAVLALVASGVVFSRRFTLKESVRNVAIWFAIAAVVAIGYAYQDVLSDIATRLRGEVLPSEPIQIDAHTMVLTESEGGGFLTTGEVDGVRVRFAVDTGASDIVLSPADAERAGIDMRNLNYSEETETANGVGHSAPARVATLRVGSFLLNDVAVSVNQAPMDSSLLGMAFLRRLKSFGVQGRRLYLRAD